jgi:hypothetical protein
MSQFEKAEKRIADIWRRLARAHRFKKGKTRGVLIDFLLVTETSKVVAHTAGGCTVIDQGNFITYEGETSLVGSAARIEEPTFQTFPQGKHFEITNPFWTNFAEPKWHNWEFSFRHSVADLRENLVYGVPGTTSSPGNQFYVIHFVAHGLHGKGSEKELPLSGWVRGVTAEKLRVTDVRYFSIVNNPNKPAFAFLWACERMQSEDPSRVLRVSLEPLAQPESREFRETIASIEIGETSYPLRTPVEGRYRQLHGGDGDYCVQEFGLAFIGRGETLQQAQRDWSEQVHIAFQELYRKRPFEMTEQERAQWAVLERAIDVAAYENQTPLTIRQIGRLVTARPDPYKILWMDNRTEVVTLAAMPAEFACFKQGQWFEAIVERDRPTGRLRKVQHVQPIDPLEPLSGPDLAEFWKDLPTTATLPRSRRDWMTR